MDPNLSDRVHFTTRGGLDIDNLDLGVESRLPATDERACVVLLGDSLDDSMLFERIGADRTEDGRFYAAAARYFQGRFRQAVCWIERFPTKAAFAKLLCKA